MTQATTPTILAIETATDACSVALLTPVGVFSKFILAPQAHSKLILGMIDEVCQQAGLVLSQVQAFAYGRGPGSFTGLRIASSVVQGLAFGMNKPVIAVSSLQALIQQVKTKRTTIPGVVALLDARMQEVYYNYSGEDCLHKAADLRFNRDAVSIAVGTGASVYKNQLLVNNPWLIIDDSILYPRASEIVELAAIEYQAGNFLTPQQAIPIYVRNNVADKKNPD